MSTKAKQCMQRIKENGLIPCFEIKYEGVFYIEARGNNLVSGTVCNIGLLPKATMEYDDCFSDDENLQALIELTEKLVKGK